MPIDIKNIAISLYIVIKSFAYKKASYKNWLQHCQSTLEQDNQLKIVCLWSKNTFNHKEEYYRQTRTCRECYHPRNHNIPDDT